MTCPSGCSTHWPVPLVAGGRLLDPVLRHPARRSWCSHLVEASHNAQVDLLEAAPPGGLGCHIRRPRTEERLPCHQHDCKTLKLFHETFIYPNGVFPTILYMVMHEQTLPFCQVPKDQVTDTVDLFHLPRQRRISLKFLAWYFLGQCLQTFFICHKIRCANVVQQYFIIYDLCLVENVLLSTEFKLRLEPFAA